MREDIFNLFVRLFGRDAFKTYMMIHGRHLESGDVKLVQAHFQRLQENLQDLEANEAS